MRRRSNLEIVYLILKRCQERSTKTQISYSAKINFKQVGKYLEELQEKGLIEASKSGRYVLYKTTDQGKNLFNKLDEIFSRLS